MLVCYKKHGTDLVNTFIRILNIIINMSIIYHRCLQKQISIPFTKENGNVKSLRKAQLPFPRYLCFHLSCR